jgi:hypothetical protein
MRLDTNWGSASDMNGQDIPMLGKNADYTAVSWLDQDNFFAKHAPNQNILYW